MNTDEPADTKLAQETGNEPLIELTKGQTKTYTVSQHSHAAAGLHVQGNVNLAREVSVPWGDSQTAGQVTGGRLQARRRNGSIVDLGPTTSCLTGSRFASLV